MVLRFLDVGKQFARIATEEDGSKKQRPPSRVAVFTIDCATVCSACAPTPHGAMYKPTVCPANDSASILLYQSLPTGVQCGEVMARRRKEDGQAGIASRETVKRLRRFSSCVRPPSCP